MLARLKARHGLSAHACRLVFCFGGFLPLRNRVVSNLCVGSQPLLLLAAEILHGEGAVFVGDQQVATPRVRSRSVALICTTVDIVTFLYV